MENTLLVALSRQSGLRRQMDVVANNIANMNTTGFKGEKMMFVEHLVRSKGGESYFGGKVHFSRDVATVRDLTEGPVTQTGNPFDLALGSEGYFVVQTPEGNRYTRNGRFQLDQNNQLVTQNGYPVLSQGGQPFTFGPLDRDIAISRDGTVSTATGVIGKVGVMRFEKEYELRQVGSSMFNTDQDPQPVNRPDVIQGALESSNIQPVIEMTRMIEIQRSYESLSRFIDREDDRLKNMIREYTRAA